MRWIESLPSRGIETAETKSEDTEFVLKDEGFVDRSAPLGLGAGEMRVTQKADGKYSLEGQAPTSRQPDGTYKTHEWAHGMTHVWIGRCTVGRYVFDGKVSNPLVFRVDKDRGYVYMKGEGVVTTPDGKTHSLPPE